MIAEKVLQAAQSSLEGRTVTDLVLGISLICVELDGSDYGVAYTLRDNLPSGCGAFGFAQKAVGKDAAEVAQLLATGTDNVQRGVASAVLNAASHSLTLADSDESGKPFGVEAQPGDKLALVGYMAPIAKQFEKLGVETVVFDLGREMAGHSDVTPCAQQAEVLPSCSIVVASGTSVTNGSVEDLLAMAPNAREFVLTGTSTPMFPAGFEGTGITCLGGAWWERSAKEAVFRAIRMGGGIASIRSHQIKKCVRV